MSQFVPLNSQTHGRLKLKPVGKYSFAQSTHLVSVVLHEFPIVSLNCPIVFVKNAQTGEFMPMALMGLEPGRNLFVQEGGAWRAGSYVPAAFRRHPFALAHDGADALYVCIDEDSDFVHTEEGEPLFDESNEMTPLLQKVKDFLLELYRSEVLAESFCQKLAELDLLVPGGLQIRDPQGVKQYDGSYVVDEKKLGELDDDKFLSLRKHGFLVGIHAHLTSLLQLDRLAAMRNNQA